MYYIVCFVISLVCLVINVLCFCIGILVYFIFNVFCLYIYICFKFIIQLKYKINKVLPTIITDFGKYYIIYLFHSSIGFYMFVHVKTCSIYNIFKN